MPVKDKKIGFIGLGRMGSGICANIQRAGFSLVVYNRTRSKMTPFLENGAEAAESPAEVAAKAEIVLTSLMDDASVLEITSGENGLLTSLRPNGIHIGLTTIRPGTSEILEKIHREADCHYIAGPVLGRPDAAAAGELKTFLSGDQQVIDICKPVYNSYTSLALNVGTAPGAANTMKVCSNYVAITQITLMGELYAFAEKSGLNPDYVLMIFQMLYAEPIMKMYAEKIKARDFDGAGFDLAAGLKDVRVYEQAFEEAGVLPGLVEVAKEKLLIGMARGLEKMDWSAIYEITRLTAGLDSRA